MKIAILAPPYLPVPPPLYGGTERIVSLLTEGLVKRGHEVTLFASGDSRTKAKLVSIFPTALGNSGFDKKNNDKPLLHYQACYDRASEFDLVHSHGQYLSLPGAAGLVTPVVFTIHGSYYKGETTEEKRAILAKYKNFNYSSISDNQRGGMPDLHFVATVYNALDTSEYLFVPKNNSDYLLWVGRVSPKKGALEAIQTAKKVGLRLEMAAAIDPIDKQYFDDVIKPHVDGVHVVFHGEVRSNALIELYGGARAVLFPISWHEPFGLVMIEAMAVGTPVVSYNCGSVPEIIENGKTGFVVEPVEGIDGLVRAVDKIGFIDRSACRGRVEKYFSSPVMVEGYEQAYQKVLASV